MADFFGPPLIASPCPCCWHASVSREWVRDPKPWRGLPLHGDAKEASGIRKRFDFPPLRIGPGSPMPLPCWSPSACKSCDAARPHPAGGACTVVKWSGARSAPALRHRGLRPKGLTAVSGCALMIRGPASTRTGSCCNGHRSNPDSWIPAQLEWTYLRLRSNAFGTHLGYALR